VWPLVEAKTILNAGQGLTSELRQATLEVLAWSLESFITRIGTSMSSAALKPSSKDRRLRSLDACWTTWPTSWTNVDRRPRVHTPLAQIAVVRDAFGQRLTSYSSYRTNDTEADVGDQVRGTCPGVAGNAMRASTR
jgi:hypothetical protein